MKKTIIIMLVITAVISCHRDHGSEEPITKVIIELQAAGNTFQYTWNDSDGPGGAEPTIDTIILDRGQNYDGKIQVKNETGGKIKDLTSEIQKLQDTHRFFYYPTNDSIVIAATDKDGKGLPVGLQYTLQTPGGSLQSTLRIILSHYDGVAKSSTPSTDLDIDITLPVKVK